MSIHLPICSGVPIHSESPICLNAPQTSVCTPAHLYVFPIRYGDSGCICTSHMFWGLGGHQHSVRHFCVCQYISCLSIPNSHSSCSPSLWVASLLDWIFMDISYAVVLFFVVFIMSQASTMAMVTTPLMTVVSSGTSSLSVVTMAPSLMELPATSGQHDVVLPPPLTPRHSGSVFGLATVPTTATSILDASSGLCHGSSTGRFLFQSWTSHYFVYYMFVSLLVSAFRCHAGCCIHLWGLNHWGAPL